MKILINIPLIGLLISYLVFLIQWWPRFQCIKRNRAKIICRYSTILPRRVWKLSLCWPSFCNSWPRWNKTDCWRNPCTTSFVARLLGFMRGFMGSAFMAGGEWREVSFWAELFRLVELWSHIWFYMIIYIPSLKAWQKNRWTLLWELDLEGSHWMANLNHSSHREVFSRGSSYVQTSFCRFFWSFHVK